MTHNARRPQGRPGRFLVLVGCALMRLGTGCARDGASRDTVDSASASGGAGAAAILGSGGAPLTQASGGRSGANGGTPGGPGVGGGGDGAAGGGAAADAACTIGTASSTDVVVTLSDVRQKISGFGASTAWSTSMSTADADLLFSPTAGVGLSLHRIRIAPDGTTTETSIARLSQARGARVWATPWSPPAADKSNDAVIGGTLSNGPAWASTIAGFVGLMKASGIDLLAVSAQNEPDAKVTTYESCGYTGTTLATFIATNLGPALAGTGVEILGPESQNWCGFKALADPILGDAMAASYTSIIATHEYGCSPLAYPAAAQAGKELWETEMYDQTLAADPGIKSGLRVARLIHDALTISSVNAWHYWWVYPSTVGNGALWDKTTGQPSKRLYVLGNFSKFVRPGFVRVGTSGAATPTGVALTAYRHPTDGTLVLAAINTNATPTDVSIFVAGASPCTLTPWVTSATDDLAARAAVPLAGSRLSATLDAQSVTTFVGQR
jgi:glucuronoarabinoxylan endo-1,4-beta-xylanase